MISIVQRFKLLSLWRCPRQWGWRGVETYSELHSRFMANEQASSWSLRHSFPSLSLSHLHFVWWCRGFWSGVSCPHYNSDAHFSLIKHWKTWFSGKRWFVVRRQYCITPYRVAQTAEEEYNAQSRKNFSTLDENFSPDYVFEKRLRCREIANMATMYWLRFSYESGVKLSWADAFPVFGEDIWCVRRMGWIKREWVNYFMKRLSDMDKKQVSDRLSDSSLGRWHSW